MCIVISRLESARQKMFGVFVIFFFQAEDGIRDLVRSRGLGDVYKRQGGRVYAVCGIADRGCPTLA